MLLDTIKVGNVEVKLYALQNRGQAFIFIKYHWAGEAKMRSVRCKTKADEKRARAIAREIATAIYSNRAEHISEIGTGTHVLKAAEDALSGLSIGVDAACREYAQARAMIGEGGTVLGAAEYFVRAKGQSLKPIKVRDAVEQFVATQEAEGASVRYVQDSRHRLRRFADEFGEQHLGDVTTSEINRWLRSLIVAPRTRNNFLSLLITLYSWSQSEGFLPRDVATAPQSVKKLKTSFEIHIFDARTVETLLSATEEADDIELIHYFGIGNFAGVRPKEMERMNDHNIRFEHNDLEVTSAQAKGQKKRRGRRRLIPMQPNLREWLERYPPRKGRSLVTSWTRNRAARLVDRLGIGWQHDAMRHTFISNAVALTQNVDQVALWAGNSRDIIYESYLNQVTPREAAALFAIRPRLESAKVIPMTR